MNSTDTHSPTPMSEEQILHFASLQWGKKPLNVITLGQTKRDNTNQMITITDDFYIVIYSKRDFEMWSH